MSKVDYPLIKNNYDNWEKVATSLFEKLSQVNFAERTRALDQEYKIASHNFKRNTLYNIGEGKRKPMAVEVLATDYPDYEIISDFFNEFPRINAYKKGFESMYSLWEKNKPELIKEVIQQHTGADRKTQNHLLRELMYTRYGKRMAECTQHKPMIPASLYTFFGAKRILDPCSGWGDRLLAALATKCELYVGVDPNERLTPGYMQIKDMFDKGNTVKMVCDRFEIFQWDKEDDFDIAYTSPPYFDLEIYSDDPNQSTSMYRTEQRWIDGFLKPMLDNCIRHVRNRGIIAINIADTHETAYVEKMLQHMKYRDQIYKGIIGYKGGRNAYQPIFIWQVRK